MQLKLHMITIEDLEPVFIAEGCRMGEGFWPCKAKNRGNSDGFQDFLTRQGGKRPTQTAFGGCEYRFLVPKEHFLRKLDAALELSFVYDTASSCKTI